MTPFGTRAHALTHFEHLALWAHSVPYWLNPIHASLLLAGGPEARSAQRDVLPAISGAVEGAASESRSRSGVYIVSEARHGPLWEELRAAGWPVTSTWHAPGALPPPPGREWVRALAEAHTARALLFYCEPSDDIHALLAAVGPAMLAVVLAGTASVVHVRPNASDHRLLHPAMHQVESLEAAEGLLRTLGVLPGPVRPVRNAPLGAIERGARSCIAEGTADLHLIHGGSEWSIPRGQDGAHDAAAVRLGAGPSGRAAAVPHRVADHIAALGPRTAVALVDEIRGLRAIALRALRGRMWWYQRVGPPALPAEYGWGIVAVDGGFAIEACGDAPPEHGAVSASDALAQRDCVERALDGDPDACRALQFLKLHSPAEYEAALVEYVAPTA